MDVEKYQKQKLRKNRNIQGLTEDIKELKNFHCQEKKAFAFSDYLEKRKRSRR